MCDNRSLYAKPSRDRGERGSALMICMLMLLVLAIMGVMFTRHSTTETQIAGHHVRHTQALYNAEAGLAEAMVRMHADVDSTINTQPTIWQSEPGWGRYLVAQTGASAADPWGAETETDGVDNDSDGTVDESGERYPEVLAVGTDMNYPWVKVEYKRNATGQPIRFGDPDGNPFTPLTQNLVDGSAVLVVTAAGIQGNARRAVRVEAVKPPFQTVDAAVYIEGDNFQFNGTQFLISGQDWDPLLQVPIPGNPEVPGIQTTGNPGSITGSLSPMQQNNVEGSGAEPSVSSSTINMDLQALAAQYAPLAEYTLPPATYDSVFWGSSTDYTVAYCTGDMHTTGTGGGGGILIIDGDFVCSGQWEWYGVVVVLGDFDLTGGGAGIHIWGTILVQGDAGQQNISGNADLLYSSAAIAQLTDLFDYRVLTWREL